MVLEHTCIYVCIFYSLFYLYLSLTGEKAFINDCTAFFSVLTEVKNLDLLTAVAQHVQQRAVATSLRYISATKTLR